VAGGDGAEWRVPGDRAGRLDRIGNHRRWDRHGTATLADGARLTFSASEASLPAGLYQRVAVENGEAVQARTIVLPDGTARGVKKAFDCAGAQSRFKQFVAVSAQAVRNSDIYDKSFAGAHRELTNAINAGCAWAA